MKTESVSVHASENEIKIMTFEAQAIGAFLDGCLKHEPNAHYLCIVARPAKNQGSENDGTGLLIFNIIRDMPPAFAELILEGALNHVRQQNALARAKPQGQA